MTRGECAARALCRFNKIPEDTKFEGRPMWESYIDEATAVLAALDTAKDVRDG